MNAETGFFIYLSTHGPRMGFRCSCCSLFTVFAEGATPEVFHCNRTERYVKPKPTFSDWLTGEELPRVRPSAPVVLRRRRQEPDEDEFLQQ